jgi:hypothetical protein
MKSVIIAAVFAISTGLIGSAWAEEAPTSTPTSPETSPQATAKKNRLYLEVAEKTEKCIWGDKCVVITSILPNNLQFATRHGAKTDSELDKNTQIFAINDREIKSMSDFNEAIAAIPDDADRIKVGTLVTHPKKPAEIRWKAADKRPDLIDGTYYAVKRENSSDTPLVWDSWIVFDMASFKKNTPNSQRVNANPWEGMILEKKGNEILIKSTAWTDIFKGKFYGIYAADRQKKLDNDKKMFDSSYKSFNAKDHQFDLVGASLKKINIGNWEEKITDEKIDENFNRINIMLSRLGAKTIYANISKPFITLEIEKGGQKYTIDIYATDGDSAFGACLKKYRDKNGTIPRQYKQQEADCQTLYPPGPNKSFQGIFGEPKSTYR